MSANKLNKLSITLSTIGLSLGLAQTAQAGTSTATLQVTASVVSNCTISTAAVSFSSYDPVVAHATVAYDATGSVTIACTKNTVASIELSNGANSNVNGRNMVNGSDNLNYLLYQDSGRTTALGTGTAKFTAPAAPSKAARTYSVYGRIPAGQDVPIGNYTDTVTATVNF